MLRYVHIIKTDDYHENTSLKYANVQTRVKSEDSPMKSHWIAKGEEIKLPLFLLLDLGIDKHRYYYYKRIFLHMNS